MNASMSCNPSRSAERADSPASANSRTIRAPSSSALRWFASRCAGIEKPSSVPPRSACSRVETRKYETASRTGASSVCSDAVASRAVVLIMSSSSEIALSLLSAAGRRWCKFCPTVEMIRLFCSDALGRREPIGVWLAVPPGTVPRLGDAQHPLDELAQIRLVSSRRPKAQTLILSLHAR